MNAANIPRILWFRKWTLAAVVIVAAAAALPFSLGGDPTYTTGTTVFAPAVPPVPDIPPQMSAPLLSQQLATYTEGALENDVRKALGSRAGGLLDVSASQSADLNTYVIEAEAETPAIAVEAADASAQALLDKADAISVEIITSLNDQVQTELAPIEQELSDLQTRLGGATFKVNQLRDEAQSLTQQMNAAKQNKLRAEAAGDEGSADIFRSEIDALQAELDNLKPELREKEGNLAILQSQVTILTTRRAGLSNFAEEAQGFNLSRRSVSRVTAAPGEPSSVNIQEVALVEGVAVLIGLLAGSVVVLLLERRRRRRAAHVATERAHAA